MAQGRWHERVDKRALLEVLLLALLIALGPTGQILPDRQQTGQTSADRTME